MKKIIIILFINIFFVSCIDLIINDDFYEDLDEASTVAILDSLRSGVTPTPGPQNSRKGGEPEGGATTLKNSKVVS